MKAIPQSNYTVQPFLTHKRQSYPYTFLSASNVVQITIDLAQIPPSTNSYSSSAYLFNSSSALINSSSGIFQIPLYAGIQNLFYHTGSVYSAPYLYKPVESQFYVISVAQQAYGEEIEPGTFLLTSPASTASISDDGLGNLFGDAVMFVTTVSSSVNWLDTFTRADGAVGSPEQGSGSYTGNTGVGFFKVSGSQLWMIANDTNQRLFGNANTSNYTLSFTASANPYKPGNTAMGVMWRYLDSNNFFQLVVLDAFGPHQYVIQHSHGGSIDTWAAPSSPTASNGDKISITSWDTANNGTGSYQILINGVQLASGSMDNSSTGGTGFGFYNGYSASVIIDNLVATGNTYTSASNPIGEVVGSINYSLGLAVLKQFTGSFSGSTVTDVGCYLNTGSQVNVAFNASHTIYEHQIVCTMDAGDFNYSTNPSVTSGSSAVSGSGKIIDQFASQSLTPYMTTIGCYTNRGELVAIGKFPRPIKRASDTQQTVILRFDI